MGTWAAYKATPRKHPKVPVEVVGIVSDDKKVAVFDGARAELLPSKLKASVMEYASLEDFPRFHLLSQLVHLNEADMETVNPYDIVTLKSVEFKDEKWGGSLVKNYSAQEDGDDDETDEDEDDVVQQPSSKPKEDVKKQKKRSWVSKLSKVTKFKIEDPVRFQNEKNQVEEFEKTWA